MGEPIETIEGWYALHDFRRIDWNRWQALSPGERAAARDELSAILEEYQSVKADDGSFALASILGHKADLLFLHFRPDPKTLGELELRLDRSPMGPVLSRPYSYVSMVELSKYLARGISEDQIHTTLKRRLEPAIPDAQYLCFYPMNKRRQGQDNWYMTSRDERRELMKNHGVIGHKYHEQVIQIITGSQGLDDWEWGVTLFADSPLPIKKLIYEMRFDEASARFADFGPFYVGPRIDATTLLARFS
ncbi:hydrogen peroxide-dependent heme synthase [Sulfobacillus harzensis]|uniref:Coproheme decarboxylase n=1 Tax=Sulfobacillus harzensis TaxID=2729629 RepID=A0A7Y0L4M9_9FIRM|nr:hydrogen peroxide-dependent heme synthase [Sulfobacillus harzensis]NMP22882.1 heme-dependent peroxidase [Sulfobacillus harzensis]